MWIWLTEWLLRDISFICYVKKYLHTFEYSKSRLSKMDRNLWRRVVDLRNGNNNAVIISAKICRNYKRKDMLKRTDADRVIAIWWIRAIESSGSAIPRNQPRKLLLLLLTISQSHQRHAMRDRGINISSWVSRHVLAHDERENEGRGS